MSGKEKTVVLPTKQLMEIVFLQLAERGSASLTITGTSMRPMLYNLKDRVLLAPPEKFGKRDIILYQRQNGQYVLHRILKKGENYCICCGDNQWQKEWVDDAWVLAVVTDFYKGNRRYSVHHMGYRAYVRFWTGIYPLRRPILGVIRRVCRLWNRGKK